ncbi:MAG: prenyltransferase/squalene oxidase repeat-containing protein, partial [Thermoplasmata archaeon]
MARIATVLMVFLLISTICLYSISSFGGSRQAMNVDASINEILLPYAGGTIIAEVPIELSVATFNNCSYEYPANVTLTITTPQIPAYIWTKNIEIMYASDYQMIIINETWVSPEVPLGFTELTFNFVANIEVPIGITDIQASNNMKSVNFVAKKSYMSAGRQALAWLIPQVSSRVSTYGIEEDIVSPTLLSIASASKSGIPYPDDTVILNGVKNAQLIDGSWSLTTPISSTASIGLGIANMVDTNSTFIPTLLSAANALVNRSTISGDWAYWIPENSDQPVNGSTIITSCSAIYVISKANRLSPTPSYANRLSQASSWLSNVSSANPRECAFIVLASVSLGIQPDEETVIENATKVILAQNTDGGWKETTTLSSSPYATGQIMYAIMSAKYSGIPSSLNNSANYLIVQQTSSGYWSLTSGNSQYSQVGKMNIAGTAWACSALRNYTHPSTSLNYNENSSIDIVMEPREESVFDIT